MVCRFEKSFHNFIISIEQRSKPQNMKLATIVKTSFIVSTLSTLIGAYQKITHSAGADTLLIIGLVATLIFIVSAVYEVRTSTKISSSEKNTWTIGLIFFSGIAGLIYLVFVRRRIA